MFLLEQVSHLFVKYATLFMWQLQNCVMFLEPSGVTDLSMDHHVIDLVGTQLQVCKMEKKKP